VSRKAAIFRMSLKALPLMTEGLYLVRHPRLPFYGEGEITGVLFDPLRKDVLFIIEGGGYPVAESQEPPNEEGPEFIPLDSLNSDQLYRLAHNKTWRRALKAHAQRLLSVIEEIETNEKS
jgi:hypothetical protein